MSRCIGIDLGTTNSVAAIREGQVRVLQNMESQDLTRSAVAIHKGRTLVGELALDQQKLNPKETIVSIKRLMGRAYRDEEVKRAKSRVAYSIVEPSDGTDDDVRVVMGGKQYSPVEISSMILKKVKEDAEKRLNDQVEYVVITVPAYFSDKQREATRRAGQMAGMKVQKILEEPTAAAYSFGVDHLDPEDAKNILVYDLGGGTFDVCVLNFVSGAFLPLNIEGDMWLGGDDFDQKIVAHVLRHISAVFGLDPSNNFKFMVDLKKKAEQVKKALSTMMRSDLSILGMLEDESGNLIDVELEITREDFEAMIAPEIAHSMDIVMQAIRGAGEGMTPQDIDRVLLVGGSSYIPLVQRSLEKIFGREKMMMNIDPMKCVAFGAAILSAKWNDKIECPICRYSNPGVNAVCENPDCGKPLNATQRCPQCKFENPQDAVKCAKCGEKLIIIDSGGITPMPYGVRTRAENILCPNGHENPGRLNRCSVAGCEAKLVGADDAFEIMIPKNTHCPMEAPAFKTFQTPTANLRRLRVEVYAGMSDRASKNDRQATVWLALPEHVPENTPVKIGLSLDHDGILREIEVALTGYSESKVSTLIDRGNTMRSRLEKKLDDLRERKQGPGRRLDSGDEVAWEQHYSAATAALNTGKLGEAQTSIAQLDNLLGAQWKRRAEGICSYTEVVLEYSDMLSTTKIQQLRTLISECQDCIERDDEAGAAKKYDELDKATDDVPADVFNIMYLQQLINQASRKNLSTEMGTLRSAILNIATAYRAKQREMANAEFDRIDPIIKKVQNAPFPEGIQEDVLGRGK